MGHIVNSKGSRVGWTTSWCDQWYSLMPYYVEHVHAMLRLRYYLAIFFSNRLFHKTAYFYSCFEIVKYFKFFHVDVFIYDGTLETELQEYLFGHFKTVSAANKDPEFRVPFRHYDVAKMFPLFLYVSQINPFEVSGKAFKRVFRVLKYFNYQTVRHFIGKDFNVKIDPYQVRFRRLLLLFAAFHWSRLNLNIYGNDVSDVDDAVRRYFNYVGYTGRCGFYFRKILILLNRRFTFFVRRYYVLVQIKFIENNEISVFFLSRFIALKFGQDYTVSDLINPIRKELIRVWRESFMTAGEYAKGYIKVNAAIQFTHVNRKTIFGFLLKFLLVKYKYYTTRFFNKFFTVFSLNMLLLYISLIKKLKNVVYLTSRYFRSRCFYVYAFNKISCTYSYYPNQKYLFRTHFTFEYNFFSNFLIKDAFLVYLDFIYQEYWVHTDVLLKTKYCKVIQTPDVFIFGQMHLARYLQYNYWMYVYGQIATNADYNNAHERNNKRSRNAALLGFKVKCSGRFTRRQRSRGFWFSVGRAPLTAVKSIVDYGYYSFPIAIV